MQTSVTQYFDSLRKSEAKAAWIAKPGSAESKVVSLSALADLAQVSQGDTPNIVLVAGTRPEIIKQAPVFLALSAGPLAARLITTGQHGEMAETALAPFGITPDVALDCVQGAATLSEIQARMLTALSAEFTKNRPDLIIVQGDTSSAFAGALTGFNMEIPVAHVEAGLTSGRKYDPYPEEMLRTLIRQMASFHFAPTSQAYAHLIETGVENEGVFLTGNTVVDAAQCVAATQNVKPEVIADLDEDASIVLVTTHRREAWGEGIDNICEAVSRLANAHPEATFVWPVHLNPLVKDAVEEKMSGRANVRLCAPLGYTDFIGVLSRSTLALTDSGGVQEEAPSFGVPVLVMRDVTERPEAVEAGLARLVGKETSAIYGQAHILLENQAVHAAMSKSQNPFGDGHSGARIARLIEEYFGALEATEVA